MKQAKGPEFLRFFRPILELLLVSGGTSTPSEIVDRSIEIAKVSESEQEAVNKNGQSRIRNQVHWARQYLVWADFLDSSKRGVWTLTEKGRSVDFNKLNPLEVFKNVQNKRFEAKRSEKQEAPSADELLPEDLEIKDHRTRLIELIRSLSPRDSSA
jgi:restriction system protein